MDKLLQRVGEITVIWAYLETEVGFCTKAIHDHWGGDKIEPGGPGMAFSRKIDFLRDCYAKIPNFSTIFHDLDDLVLQLEQAGDHRHQIIHGLAENLERFAKKGRYKTVRYKGPLKGKLYVSRAAYSFRELRTFRNHCLKLAIFWGAFAEILLGQHKTKDSLGNLLKKLS